MLNVKKLIESAEACLGWPYVSPGSNDRNGIDCSGLLVKCFRDQGASIYHGSNTIYRKYCSEKGEITSAGMLIPGMAVFKWNPNTPERFDDGQGDFQHVGLVTSVNPLRIIHASSAVGCVTTDTKLGKWKFWGKLKDVDYISETPGSSSEDEMVEKIDEPRTGYITTNKVNLRTGPSASKPRIEYLNTGDKVEVLAESGSWLKCRWNGKTGFVMAGFVAFDAPASSTVDESNTDETEIEADDEVETVRVVSANGGKINIRRGNDLHYARITSVPSGTSLPYIGLATNGWIAVKIGSYVGWVSPEYAEVEP